MLFHETRQYNIKMFDSYLFQVYGKTKLQKQVSYLS